MDSNSRESYSPHESGKNYLTIVKYGNDAVFAQRVTGNTEGAVQRVLGEESPNAGSTIYELYFKSVTGVVQDVRVKDGNFGREFLIFMKHIDETNVIQVRFGGDYMSSFLSKSIWMKKGDTIKISPFDFTPKPTTDNRDPRRMLGFSMWINGVQVKAVDGKPVMINGHEVSGPKKWADSMFPPTMPRLPIWDPENEKGGNPDFLDRKEYTLNFWNVRMTNWYLKTLIPMYRTKYGMDVAGISDTTIQTPTTPPAAKEVVERFPETPPEQGSQVDDLPF